MHSKLRSVAAAFILAAVIDILAPRGAAIAGEGASRVSPVPTVSGDWSGPYAGIGLGARWTDATWRTTCLHPALTNCSPPYDGFPARFANDNPAAFDMGGARIGAYTGYNWQISNWLAGIEADIAWGKDKKSHRGIPGTWDPLLGPGQDTAVLSAMWDGSLRGRLGLLATPDLLFYGTAGFAWLQMTANPSCAGTFPVGWCVNPNTASVTKLLPGWTIGAGLEGRMSPKWLLRAEYRYTEYQNFSATFFESMPIESFKVEVSPRSHVLYLGVSYLFGGK